MAPGVQDPFRSLKTPVVARQGPQLHLIYTATDILLSRRGYADWRDIQAEHATYKASLGPWGAEDIIAYLDDEYAQLYPSARAQVDAFLDGPLDILALTFQR